MKAVVYEGPGKIVVKEMPEPRPREGEVLLRPLYVGVCLTDVANYTNGAGAGMPGLIMGHEASGEVIEVGPGVTGLAPGDRVAIDPTLYCGRCAPCQGGLYTMCQARMGPPFLGKWLGIDSRTRDAQPEYHGMLAERCAAPAYTCVKLPENVSARDAATLEVAAIALRTVRGSSLRVGDDVVVLGGSDLGLRCMQWARAAGARRVVVVEPIKVRREMAERLGADLAIDPGEVNPVKRTYQAIPNGADVVFAIPDVRGYLEMAYKIARIQGHVAIPTAVYTHDPALAGFPPSVLVGKEITLSSVMCFGIEPWRGGRARGDFQTALDFLAAGRLGGAAYVTRVIPWAAVDDIVALAYQRLPEQEVKVMVQVSR